MTAAPNKGGRPRKHPEGTTAAERVAISTQALQEAGGARKTFRHTQANAPLRANATLEAIGGTAVWLTSDWAACTTGEIVTVDGGYHVLGMPQSENL